MNMHRLARLPSFLSVLALLLAACGAPGDDVSSGDVGAEAECDPFKIGTFFSITGPASFLGEPERDTVEMLQEQFDAAGGVEGPGGTMVAVEIVIEDSQSSPDGAMLAAERLIKEEGVHIVVGGTTSPASIAVKDIFNEAKVPFISVASSSAIVSPVEDAYWIFKTPQQNLPVAGLQARYLSANGITRVASLYVNDAFGQDSRDGLRAVAAEEGIEIVVEDSFEATDTDFTTQLTDVLTSDAEVLIVHATPSTAAPLTIEARALGWDKPILHNHGIGTPDFIDLAGADAEGVLFPIGKLLIWEDLPTDDPQRAILEQYAADFEAFTGRAPSTFGGHAWDGIMMAIEAFSAVGCDPTALRDYLETGFTDWPGVSGVFNITPEDHNGIGFESLALVQIKDGAFAYVPPEEYASVP